MDEEKRESGATEKAKSTTTTAAAVDEALKKCMEENRGDRSKCKSKVEAFKSISSQKPVTPLMLRSGSLTDCRHADPDREVISLRVSTVLDN